MRAAFAEVEYAARVAGLRGIRVAADTGHLPEGRTEALQEIVDAVELGSFVVEPSLPVINRVAAALAPGIPPCPYAPLGVSVGYDFLPPDNRLVFRCLHAPLAHCWDGLGTLPFQC